MARIGALGWHEFSGPNDEIDRIVGRYETARVLFDHRDQLPHQVPGPTFELTMNESRSPALYIDQVVVEEWEYANGLLTFPGSDDGWSGRLTFFRNDDDVAIIGTIARWSVGPWRIIPNVVGRLVNGNMIASQRSTADQLPWLDILGNGTSVLAETAQASAIALLTAVVDFCSEGVFDDATVERLERFGTRAFTTTRPLFDPPS